MLSRTRPVMAIGDRELSQREHLRRSRAHGLGLVLTAERRGDERRADGVS